ncbi:MAG: anthranilate phosphoribosyltransferase [Desulfomonilaceae bacterium]|nr:anthranilate phosphoribosyltransferase [Desulfomonilaceae bacterium]
MLRHAIQKATDGKDLTADEMEAAMEEIMDGKATSAQIGSFLTALKMKGETVDEITGAANVMRRKAIPVHVDDNGTPLLDTAGTGGDGSGTFNISTTSAFILAGAGVRVAKHGNRSVSSSCGSADVLQALGADLDRTPEDVACCINKTGFGFLFAPMHHIAMKHAAGPRKEMGIRTVFNLLGPLTNPALASYQLLGVYDPDLTEPLAHALNGLGTRCAMVVHGLDGLDEVSVSAPTKVSHLKDGTVVTTTMDPRRIGIDLCDRSEIRGGTAEENAVHLRAVLDGEQGPRRIVSLLNAAAALVVTGSVEDLSEGMVLAAQSVDSGAARSKLDEYLGFKETS